MKPTSLARILANRQNALNSTGPRTTAGKARSSGNSLRQGLTSRRLSFTNAEAELYRALIVTWLRHLDISQPDEFQAACLHRAATCWIRADRAGVQARHFEAQGVDPRVVARARLYERRDRARVQYDLEAIAGSFPPPPRDPSPWANPRNEPNALPAPQALPPGLSH